MKKHLLILGFVILTTALAKSQNTCLDAIRIYYNATDSIPPAGTISPAGPDLGCLTITERQTWFYAPLCEDASAFHFIVNSGNSSNDTMGVIIYGPFSEKVNNCADLDASKIISCCQQTGLQMGCFYNDTVYQGKYYYFLVTFSNGGNSHVVHVYFDNPNISDQCFECNNQVSLISEDNICIATVDTAINKCYLSWDEFPNINLAGYKVLRESNLVGVFDTIATVPLGSLSELTDSSSNALQRSYRYSVVGVDSCGNSYPPSKYLTTIHLLAFPGLNNIAQLIWNNVYMSNAGFEPQYFIYRNSNGSGWQLIDSIGITLQTMTYTDTYAPAGINAYTVELRKTVACVPTRMTATGYQPVFSNVTAVNVTNVEELTNSARIRIYPNPASDKFTIDLNYLDMNVVDISIIDMEGKKCFELFNVSEKSILIERQNLKAGIYTVIIKGEKIYRSRLALQ